MLVGHGLMNGEITAVAINVPAQVTKGALRVMAVPVIVTRAPPVMLTRPPAVTVTVAPPVIATVPAAVVVIDAPIVVVCDAPTLTVSETPTVVVRLIAIDCVCVPSTVVSSVA